MEEKSLLKQKEYWRDKDKVKTDFLRRRISNYSLENKTAIEITKEFSVIKDSVNEM
mgnify:CR=1 FL=1